MNAFATLQDIITLFRPLTSDETCKASELLTIVSNSLRYEADKVGKDLDRMIIDNPHLYDVVKSVTVDVVARTLMTATDGEPMTQRTESALGYSVSGSYLVPGGGLFIKRSELARIGIKRQAIKAVEIYGND